MTTLVTRLIFKCWEVPGAKVPAPNERVLTVIMSPEVTNTRQLTLLTSIISPGFTTGLHQHEIDEFMYVAAGRGEFVKEGKAKPFEPDTVLFGEANKEHEVKNTGKETVKLICIYSPPLKPAGYFEKAVEATKEHLQKSAH